jgi:Type IV secretion-system coupling protein DNA-binding domain/Helicase HerA, central domain
MGANRPTTTNASNPVNTTTKTTWHLTAAMPHPNSQNLAKAGLGAALSSLEIGESFDLVLAVRSRLSSGAKIAIRVEHSVKASSESRTSPCAANAMRFSNPAFRFEPSSRSSSKRAFAWSWQIQEEAFAAKRAAVGFQDPTRVVPETHRTIRDRMEVALLADEAPESAWRSIDEILMALSVSGAEAEVRLSWTAAIVLAGLYSTAIDPSFWRASERDEQTLETALQLEVSVHADFALPVNLLKSIGRVVYETPCIRVHRRERLEGPEVPHIQVEQVLRPRDDIPACVLPSPDLLIKSGVRRSFADAPADLPTKGTPVGLILGLGKKKVVIPDIERSRHIYVVGATGTGKSTMLLEMLRGDMRKGAGVMLIDPHGDLFAEAMAMVPPSRSGDLVVLDASFSGRPFPLNVLSMAGMPKARAATFVTNELLSIFASLYDMKACGGPMFELYFTNAMSLIMNSNLVRPSLSDLASVFEDVRFRRDCIEACVDPIAVRFWKQTAIKTSGDVSLENIAPYIFSKVNRFVQDANLRPILAGRESGIDFREAMDNNKIVLVNLAKGQIGAQSARFLGMAIMMRLLAATLARGNVAERERRPFFVHVDEFQALATESAGTFLAEARKFGVCMTLASQTLAQLRVGGSELADTVTGNCGTLIMTRLGPKDAENLARTYGPDLTPSDMQSLPSFHAVGRFLAREIPPPPFVFGVPKPRRRSFGKQVYQESLVVAQSEVGTDVQPTLPLVPEFHDLLELSGSNHTSSLREAA